MSAKSQGDAGLPPAVGRPINSKRIVRLRNDGDDMLKTSANDLQAARFLRFILKYSFPPQAAD